MKIGSTPIMPAAGRPAANPPPSVRPGDGGFSGTMQGSLRNGYLKIRVDDLFKPVVETGTARFAVETSIGDDAVRFDARPIVAPTATGGDLPAVGTAPVSPENEGGSQPGGTAQSALVDLVEELAERLPLIAGPNETSGREALRTAAAMLAENGAADLTGTAAPVMPGSTGIARAPAAPENPRETASANTREPPPFMSTARTAAKVTAFPREVVVVLRGISLSAEESLALAEKMRGILGKHQLGDRMIRITAMEART